MITLSVVLLVSLLLAVVTAGVAAACWLCVGVERLRTVRTQTPWFRRRVRTVAPFLAALAFVLAMNKGLQDRIEQFSHDYGFDATTTLYAVEGDLVTTFQGSLPDVTMLYFSAVYVVGYAILLLTPLVVYLFAERVRPLASLVVAYAVNYAIAVVCYALVVAYGPRNADRASDGTGADAPLLELVPDITAITALVNTNTNVFPSLHASLSITVLLVAAGTRAEFRRWFGLATVLAVSIVLSTMALGIHWATDVVAGAVLAVVAVGLAPPIVDRVATRSD